MHRRSTTNEAGKRVLRRIRRITPFLEGSLTSTKKRCGHPTCRCVHEGPLHEATLLTWKEANNTRTLSIHRGLREEVARWVKETKQLTQLIHQMSHAQRAFLISRKRSITR